MEDDTTKDSLPMLDVLVVSPHPDDAELGMAGGILKLKADGVSVGVLDLTNGEPTPFGSPEIRARETAAATAILELDWRENLGLPNRSLEPSIEARAKLAAVFRQTRPRWIFAPYWIDAHPDHIAATELIEAARFWSKLTKTDMPGEPHYPERIYHYYCVHLRHIPQPAFILDISDYWEKKRAAIECYRSQFLVGRIANPSYASQTASPSRADERKAPDSPTVIDRIRDQAATWGWAIGARYGEPFAAREPIGLSSLRALV
jgi:bacillithiol biosynthesis deacetylase BshB1